MKRNRPAPYSTCILRCPTGVYKIVGSVPLALCDKVWNTEMEVKAALIDIGCPFFQFADCSWYPKRPVGKADQKTLYTFYGL